MPATSFHGLAITWNNVVVPLVKRVEIGHESAAAVAQTPITAKVFGAGTMSARVIQGNAFASVEPLAISADCFGEPLNAFINLQGTEGTLKLTREDSAGNVTTLLDSLAVLVESNLAATTNEFTDYKLKWIVTPEETAP